MYGHSLYTHAPYHPGDILYVRETWQYMYDLDGNDQIIEDTGRYVYAADGFNVDTWINPDGTHRFGIPWRPSIHMPKEAARIWLKVTDVRVERLQDITIAEVIKEGCADIWIDAARIRKLIDVAGIKMNLPICGITLSKRKTFCFMGGTQTRGYGG